MFIDGHCHLQGDICLRHPAWGQNHPGRMGWLGGSGRTCRGLFRTRRVPLDNQNLGGSGTAGQRLIKRKAQGRYHGRNIIIIDLHHRTSDPERGTLLPAGYVPLRGPVPKSDHRLRHGRGSHFRGHPDLGAGVRAACVHFGVWINRHCVARFKRITVQTVFGGKRRWRKIAHQYSHGREGLRLFLRSYRQLKLVPADCRRWRGRKTARHWTKLIQLQFQFRRNMRRQLTLCARRMLAPSRRLMKNGLLSVFSLKNPFSESVALKIELF